MRRNSRTHNETRTIHVSWLIALKDLLFLFQKTHPNVCQLSVKFGALGRVTTAGERKKKENKMNRVTHFEIYSEDPEAVQPFYRDVFGWKFHKFEGGPSEYWLVTTGDDKEPGINGGMTRPREGQSAGTLNTVAVKSLDQTMKKLEQRGGKMSVPKMAIPTVGWLAYAADPAGNVFGIIEPDSTQ
jgi:hypothetical protein